MTPSKHRNSGEIRNLQSLLVSLVDETSGDTVNVEDLLNAVGRRAFGPLLLLLGFIAISPLTIVPGTSWLVAVITILIAGQVVLGQARPWLPRKALAASFPRTALVRGVELMQEPAYIIDQLVCPRIGFLTAPPFLQLTALLSIVAALACFPLGLVPFGPFLPALAIMLIGLGLTARDGIMVLLAGSAVLGSTLLLFRVAEKLF